MDKLEMLKQWLNNFDYNKPGFTLLKFTMGLYAEIDHLQYEPEPEEFCEWKYFEKDCLGFFKTDCGENQWDEHHHSRAKNCCFCGRKIKEV